MRDAKKRIQTTRSRRKNVLKPQPLNGSKRIRGLLGPVTGVPQRLKMQIGCRVFPPSTVRGHSDFCLRRLALRAFRATGTIEFGTMISDAGRGRRSQQV